MSYYNINGINNLNKKIQNVSNQINNYEKNLIPQSKVDVIKANVYETEEEQAYESAQNKYDTLLYDISSVLISQADTIARIKNNYNIETTTRDAEIFAANETGLKGAGLIRSKNINEIEKHRLYELIQKENIVLNQYHNDLVDKLYTYERGYNFNSMNVEFYKHINTYMLYTYILLVLICSYYMYYALPWETRYKAILFVMFMLYPFFIQNVEIYIYDNIMYLYSLIFALPYKPLTL